VRKRVLVIEDNPLDQELLVALLDNTRFEVQIAEGGGLGLSAAIARVPDVILLDLRLPDMDGYEVCRLLRLERQTERVPIVIVTASDDPALNRLAYDAGAQACLTKPFRKEALLTAIEAVFAGHGRKRAGSGRGKRTLPPEEPKGRALVWESHGPFRGGQIWVKELGATAWTAAITPLPQSSEDLGPIGAVPNEMILPQVFDSRVAAQAAAEKHINQEVDRQVQPEALEVGDRMGGAKKYQAGRRFERFPVYLPVLGLGSQLDQGELLGMVRNVSAGGMMVEFPVELVPGTGLDLALLTQNGPVEVEARTVWTAAGQGTVRHGLAFPQPKDYDFAVALHVEQTIQVF
jgi:CheY-like chemotaxis protein